jgi:cytochrome P450
MHDVLHGLLLGEVEVQASSVRHIPAICTYWERRVADPYAGAVVDAELTGSGQPVVAAGDIPGPSGPEMLANVRLIRHRPPEFLARCAKRYGPVVRFPIPRADVLLATDPADVRRVLQTNHSAYSKRTLQYDSLALVTGRGLLASDGDVWRRMRRVMSPAFHRGLVTDMTQSIADVADTWSREMLSRSPAQIDVEAAMLELSLCLVGETLFAGTLDRPGTLVTAVTDALRVVVAQAQIPVALPRSWPTRSNRRLTASLGVLDRAVDTMLARRRDNPAGDDVLWSLIAALDAGVVNRQEVRNEVVTLIVAGHETIAATLTWTWALLAEHPEVEQRVHAEVDQIDDGALTKPGILEELPYTRAVVDECLRLYPPAWVVTRRCIRPDVLSGCEIPAGATVILSPFVMHRDARLWSRPTVFEPQRFMGSEASDTGRRSLNYLPFGAGPRLCIGRDLALLEAPVVVASLARRLVFRLERPSEITLDFGVTLRPSGGLPAMAAARRRART